MKTRDWSSHFLCVCEGSFPSCWPRGIHPYLSIPILTGGQKKLVGCADQCAVVNREVSAGVDTNRVRL